MPKNGKPSCTISLGCFQPPMFQFRCRNSAGVILPSLQRAQAVLHADVVPGRRARRRWRRRHRHCAGRRSASSGWRRCRSAARRTAGSAPGRTRGSGYRLQPRPIDDKRDSAVHTTGNALIRSLAFGLTQASLPTGQTRTILRLQHAEVRMATTKFLLDESKMPKHWYNIAADLPAPAPPVLHPGTLQPVGPGRPGAAVPDGADHAGGSPPSARSRSPSRCARSSASGGRRRCSARTGWRRRSARRRRSTTSTKACRPPASHKPNTAVPQAWYNAQAGIKKLTTETGAGQWGSSLAFAGALFGIEVTVFKVRVSYDQKPYRRALMETYGATLHRPPVERDQLRPRDPGASDPTTRARWASPSPRRWKSRPRTTTPSTRSARC